MYKSIVFSKKCLHNSRRIPINTRILKAQGYLEHLFIAKLRSYIFLIMTDIKIILLIVQENSEKNIALKLTEVPSKSALAADVQGQNPGTFHVIIGSDEKLRDMNLCFSGILVVQVYSAI